MMSIQGRLQGRLQGRINTRIYQRKRKIETRGKRLEARSPEDYKYPIVYLMR